MLFCHCLRQAYLEWENKKCQQRSELAYELQTRRTKQHSNRKAESVAAPKRVPSILTLKVLPVHDRHAIFFFYIDSNTFQLKLHKISETLTSASLRGCQIQLFDFNSNCMNFHLGIFNSAYVYYHNKVKAVQFFPRANFSGKKEKKRIK